jgi:hypothetical protein
MKRALNIIPTVCETSIAFSVSCISLRICLSHSYDRKITFSSLTAPFTLDQRPNLSCNLHDRQSESLVDKLVRAHVSCSRRRDDTSLTRSSERSGARASTTRRPSRTQIESPGPNTADLSTRPWQNTRGTTLRNKSTTLEHHRATLSGTWA